MYSLPQDLMSQLFLRRSRRTRGNEEALDSGRDLLELILSFNTTNDSSNDDDDDDGGDDNTNLQDTFS